MEAIATEPRLMPHLHLSLQAGDDLILKRMKRRHLRDDAIRFCEEARAAAPRHGLRRRHHRGLPDRDRGDVRELAAARGGGLRADLAARLPLQPAQGHARRADAAGGRRGDQGRAARLRAAGEAAVARHLAGLEGQVRDVLTESPRMGRTECFAEVRFDRPAGGRHGADAARCRSRRSGGGRAGARGLCPRRLTATPPE
jgi:threonylcarbamoyladenosine tRNA methylthiotransferase MtaB